MAAFPRPSSALPTAEFWRGATATVSSGVLTVTLTGDAAPGGEARSSARIAAWGRKNDQDRGLTGSAEPSDLLFSEFEGTPGPGHHFLS